MRKGQTSVRGGIQDLLCPFEYVAITQASGVGTHKGTRAVDIGFKSASNPREAFYAPCDVKCVWTYPQNGQAMWQSLNKVRLANGKIDYVTFVTCHDNSFDAREGQIVKQGVQLGNKGNKGGATGIHTHIEIALGRKTLNNWYKNSYGIYTMNDEIDFDSAFFMDNTEVKSILGIEQWKYLKDVPVSENKPSNGAYTINAYGDKIEKGCKVSVRANFQYGGKSKFVVNYDKYDVIEVNGTRAVIGIGNTVTTAIHVDNLKRL